MSTKQSSEYIKMYKRRKRSSRPFVKAVLDASAFVDFCTLAEKAGVTVDELGGQVLAKFVEQKRQQ